MQNRRLLLVPSLVLLFCLTPLSIMAASLAVSWNANTESNLAGYRVYYGNASRNYPYAIDVGKVTSYRISGVSQGKTYYVALSAYDTDGNSSVLSDEVSASVPVATTTSSASASARSASILLVSPASGAVLTGTPTLAWSSRSVTTYALYLSINNSAYYKMYSGTKNSFKLPASLWLWFVPSGSMIKWYVVGTGSDGKQVASAVRYFTKK